MSRPFDPRKHEWRGGGWRHHVPWYTLDSQGRGRIRCSEPECEVNQRPVEAPR